MKHPSQVPSDVYRMLVTKVIPAEDQLYDIAHQLGEEVKTAFLEAMGPEQERKGRLRLSSVGKPDRQIKMAYDGIEGDKLEGHTHIKFLFGHLTEALILALVKAAGHEVTDQQKECDVLGVKGHMDGRVDGVLMDVKSASSYGFKKFKDGTLPYDDPFGYIGQIKAYAHQEGDREFGWLAFDKQNGHLCWLGYDLDDLSPDLEKLLDYDITERVEEIKKLVGLEEMPDLCYEPIADGKTGNMKLPAGCSYCQFKHQCYPNLRTFLYGSGPRYLTDVVSEPRVAELPKEW